MARVNSSRKNSKAKYERPNPSMIELCRSIEKGNIPASSFAKLLENHSDLLMQMAIADRPDCPRDVLDTLVRLEDNRIQKRAVGNKNYPISSIRALLGIQNRKNISAAVDNFSPKTLHAIVSRPDCPADVLHFLAGSSSQDLVESIAEHPNTSPATLRMLSDHPWYLISRRVVENPHCPVDVLDRLSIGTPLSLKKSILANPGFGSDKIIAWLKKAELNLMASYNQIEVINVVLSNNPNPDTFYTVADIEGLNPAVYKALLSHPKCPQDLAFLLSLDV